MININYQKRKNIELFKTLEEPTCLFLSNTQNYIPIYKKFFSLNETNYNNINLNNKWYISCVNNNNENENENDEFFKVYDCRLKNMNTNKIKDKEVFFKQAPLLDPFKYLIGKYNVNDTKLFNLPKFNSNLDDCNSKLIDMNNSAYVDGLFIFLTSKLLHEHKFIHGVDYYGSFLAIKNNYKINVFDDIDYLNSSEFFNKNKNILFTIDDYEHLFQDENTKLNPIKIGNDISSKSRLSIKSVDNKLFEDIFEENKIIDLAEMKDLSFDLVDITNDTILNNDHKLTLKSNSTCSSRSSYTNDDDIESDYENDYIQKENEVFDSGSETIYEKNSDNTEWETFYDDEHKNYTDNEHDNKEDDDNEHDDNEHDDNEHDDNEDDDDEIINVTIPRFPIQLIAMEHCEDTFDELILSNKLTNEEWYSALMQIIMILITYQKCFNFTHNDLHSNNIMYNNTERKYIYYCYKKKFYKVPTYGRIFKIIDFGRSIYKFDGKLFCSDSFQIGGDAATQYNTEPYFNDKKPRLEPNFSFDLCRLACSIFDYVIDDFEKMKDLSKIDDPIKRLIFEWCLDDKGINMLYKNNGVERYPDFKLYKMISRCVHNHTPQAQLERPEFDLFSKFNNIIKDTDILINIDNIPSYVL
jgi:hypothetical protein